MSAINASGCGSGKVLAVPGEREGQRLDNFLLGFFKHVPRSLLYRLIRQGRIRVDRKRVRPAFRLEAGQMIQLPAIQDLAPVPAVNEKVQYKHDIRRLILYEDASLLVLNKPAGLAVHGGSGLSFGVIELLRRQRADLPFVELVHRLDRETSGCLMIAKRRSMLLFLHQALRQQQLVKRYQALVAGTWPKRRHTVSCPLEKYVNRAGQRFVKVSAGGKPSVTRFTLAQRFRESSLIVAQPVTGRTHQIRVHSAHVQRPILGDEKYGDPELNRRWRRLGLHRLFLHACEVEIPQRHGSRPLTVRAPLDDQLVALLERLAA